MINMAFNVERAKEWKKASKSKSSSINFRCNGWKSTNSLGLVK